MEGFLFYIAPIGSIVGLLFALIFYKMMMKADEGTDKMIEIAGYVREGAMAYLSRQYKVITVVFIILFFVFVGLVYMGVMNPFVPFAFLLGGFFSGLCGYIGMRTATQASNRTAQAASISLNQGLKVAFRSGAVMGLVVVGFGLLFIVLSYLGLSWVYNNHVWGFGEGLTDRAQLIELTTIMLTFGMGASTQALFARVGGGIYTKAADVGADLVGKVEANIPEDDPRNPATIADNVGDNVGDVAGMGADLYESYVGSILATIALGAALPAIAYADAIQFATAPMIIAGLGILFSIVGIFAVKTKEDASMAALLKALNVGIWGSSFLILIALAVMAKTGFITWGVFGAVVAGLLAGLIIGQSTEYYTSDENKPTQSIADQAQMGHATAIIEGLSVGMLSTAIPVVTICAGILAAFGLAGGFENVANGLYGISFAAVGMLSTLGITLATDAYGPIADNAGGSAEMSGLDPSVRQKTDALDMLGNTTAATGKGFALGSAALTAMALLAAYLEQIKFWIQGLAAEAGRFIQVGQVKFYESLESLPEGIASGQVESIIINGKQSFISHVAAEQATMHDFMTAFDITLMNPLLLAGVFLGAMMAFLFSALTMKAVGRAAGEMVNEVRRQFKEIPGIMEGTGKPDYARCVAISTRGAQREMVLPSVLAILIPVVVGLALGVAGVMGLLVGALTAGFSLACMLNNSGGAWDNAKKFIEKGNFGGKGSEAHKAGVTGDTVGDPFKDTSGPSLNILIKLMTMVSVVFSGAVLKYSLEIQKLLGLN